MKIWICAIAKMEELYIKEWIEWNKKIGIDHIILGDNNDSNYDIPLQTIIQNYIDDGYVELINQQDILGAQHPFYNEVYLNKRNEFDWIGFIDIDEFIELPAFNNDIHLYLNDNRLDNIDAVIFPWLYYGDNEQLNYEDKPVKERFTTFQIRPKSGIKYFIRSLNKISKIVSFHSPYYNKYIDGYQVKCCDSLFNQKFKPCLENVNLNKFTKIYITNDLIFNFAYIGHYVTKSTEEYIKYRMLRGRCDRKVGNYKIRHSIGYYFDYNNITKEKTDLFDSYYNIINETNNKLLLKYQN